MNLTVLSTNHLSVVVVESLNGMPFSDCWSLWRQLVLMAEFTALHRDSHKPRLASSERCNWFMTFFRPGSNHENPRAGLDTKAQQPPGRSSLMGSSDSVYLFWAKHLLWGSGSQNLRLADGTYNFAVFQRECNVDEMQPSCSVGAHGTSHWTSWCNSHKFSTQITLQRRGFKSGGMFAKIEKSSKLLLGMLPWPCGWSTQGLWQVCCSLDLFLQLWAPLSKNISLWLSLLSTKAREVIELRT